MTGAGTPRLALVAHDVHDEGGMERVVAELVRRLTGDFDVVVVSSTLAPDLRSWSAGSGCGCRRRRSP